MTWDGLDTHYFPTSLIFKACLLLDRCIPLLSCGIKDKLNGVIRYSQRWVKLPPTSEEYLFVFEIEKTVSAPELVFEFRSNNKYWEIKECGIHPLETLARSC